MDKSHRRRLIGRILILALLVGLVGFAVVRFRALQNSQKPLELLNLETYHDVTGTGDWNPETELSKELAEHIRSSYFKAWTAWNLALLGDEEQKLERHYSGPALHLSLIHI